MDHSPSSSSPAVTDHVVKRIAAGIAQGDIVPILGAGCSAKQVDEAGKCFAGFPLASQFSKKAAEWHRYLEAHEEFEKCSALIETHDGPQVLIDDLVRVYAPAQRLPTYDLISQLRFDTVVTFNFDESLSSSLAEAGRLPRIVVTDEDVPSARSAAVRVIKPHGTASRPGTLRATRRQVGEFEIDCPLVRSLLEVLLANREPLFIGYGFGDQDIVGALQRVRRWVGRSYRRGTAVLLHASAGLRAELEQMNIDVIEGDAVSVLSAICAEYTRHEQIDPEDSERWRAHPFFRNLMSIRGRPTETQVIEALLDAACRRIPQSTSVRDVSTQAADAADLCLGYRPMLAGLRHVSSQLRAIASEADDEAAWIEWGKYISRRKKVREQLALRSGEVIGPHKRLMLYSQSQRVIDLLLDANPCLYRDMDIVIPECRAKSPYPFQNAVLIAEQLLGKGFKSLQIVADVVGLHLICIGQIDAILMGAHTVFCPGDSDLPVGIVNSVGTEAVCIAADSVGIPVIFVFEDEKIVRVANLDDAKQRVSYEPECNLESTAGLASLLARDDHISVTQIGYDLVQWRGNLLAVVGKIGEEDRELA